MRAVIHTPRFNKTAISSLSGLALAALWLMIAGQALAWDCQNEEIPFTHEPSDYYGSGIYYTGCPGDGADIECYHYHRHWVCDKGDWLYWDRNLDSAARAACGCPMRPGVVPSAPAVSKKPAKRIHR